MSLKTCLISFTNILLVLFMIGVIASISAVFLVYHIHRVQHQNDDIPALVIEQSEIEEAIKSASIQLVIFILLVSMVLFNYLMTVMTAPGKIPEKSVWRKMGRPSLVNDTKRTGEMRHCKHCDCYKPDRAHHCRVCNACSLRMDHHCPWVNNCIGFRNHKYFFLLILYSTIASIYVCVCMYPSVTDVIEEPQCSFVETFSLVFGETIAIFLSALMLVFLSFHIFLMLKGMSTIEFCEKCDCESFSSKYSLGFYKNVAAVLGRNPLLWFVPFGFPEGDGCFFETNNHGAIIQSKRSFVI